MFVALQPGVSTKGDMTSGTPENTGKDRSKCGTNRDERMRSIVIENRRVSSVIYSKVDNLDIASSANLRHSPRVTVAEHANRVQIYEPNTSSSSTLPLPSRPTKFRWLIQQRQLLLKDF